MKINRIKKLKNKLLNFNIVNTKIYKVLKYYSPLTIESIELTLKKALFIIYKHHINNKKIIFIGAPLKLNKKLKFVFKNTKHIFIPQSLWNDGVISNRLSLKKTETAKLLGKLDQTPDLIVVLNETVHINILKESYKTKIPTIFFCNLINQNFNYVVRGDFKFSQKQIRNNFFYSILITPLKNKK